MYEAPPTAPALPAPDQRPPGLGTGCLWSLVSQLVFYLLFVLIPVYISGMYRWSESDIILWGQFDPLFYEDLTYANGGWRISAGLLLIIISNYLLPVVP